MTTEKFIVNESHSQLNEYLDYMENSAPFDLEYILLDR